MKGGGGGGGRREFNTARRTPLQWHAEVIFQHHALRGEQKLIPQCYAPHDVARTIIIVIIIARVYNN